MRDLANILTPLGVTCSTLFVEHLRIDSREIQSGDAFIALRGHIQNGEEYVHAAFEQGAKCVLVDRESDVLPEDSRVIRVTDLKKRIAQIASDFYGRPSEQIKLVGVTGTNGKSTTTAMIANLAQLCDTPSAVIGTLGYGPVEQLTPLANTTPSSIDLQRILATLRETAQLVAMEVSSHGLEQDRVGQSRFEAAVFTNLSRDHLDYHGSMQAYANAKLKLFKTCHPRVSVLNIDDEYALQWLDEHTFDHLVVYGLKPAQHNFSQYVWFDDVHCSQYGIRAKIHTSWGDKDVELPLFGLFNLYNLAASLATLLMLGYDLKALLRAASKLKPVAGRMEATFTVNKPTCVVDYAHTPDALELALKALQQHVPGNVVCVFGCGGDRDVGKRALMAQAAEKYANKVIITSDNPRSEDPDKIIADVKAGLSQPQYAYCQSDRALAIKYAIEQSPNNSVILIAGKGHEDYQIIGQQRIAFCDRQWVKTILEGKGA
ncbi:UDP-N-acetylmuramoyl-L-alanyl-D-glutamate--2,6-diaminopimelate ligase [Pseudoalteromonas citrea]|uniref:UDP-N-acetylmuramoyl-L-alanyl-D-glutamate--2,6-diaminopimelate ligase n=1 Tax=Pseudoalteromonas citrea TaxID=43655 RepID=A0A5S3XPC4_9GAMM|nr:UDP-N-acetylmuramoyl-L-alanyl-D-glutamate--2,6-diaminopimelate ligase [Pseudoalteromonas citrea]TMP45657.1 UDP-N-acetylmuramoyl-L-alanyl-D-glutamate--2,6-diaminopimelate ligase [Pseudoalteromonas citrea]TMP59037.1 UDP-N-acetylmuramoyl-L-alanyl-D-glutamate--2,6-diaminopimelate ligase [Pseudoalteromonas citrea]